MEVIFICTKSITFNTFLETQANYLLKKGFKVKVACSDVENLNTKKIVSYKISYPTKYFDFINIFKYFKILLQIKTLINNNQSSVFYLHTPVASHLFRFFALAYDLKIIYFVHGFRFYSKTNFFSSIFFKFIEKALSLKTKVFITINKEDFNYAKNNLFKKAHVYKINGIGLNLKNKDKKKNLIKKTNVSNILVIAAYKNSKGYIEILKVAELLKKKNIIITCYGYGEKKNYENIKTKKKTQ